MPTGKKYLKLRKDLIISAAILTLFVAGWYLFLYRDLIADTNDLRIKMESDQDSIHFIEKYKNLDIDLKLQIEKLNDEIEVWDSRFPPRSSLVEIARNLIGFCNNHGLQLVDMKPSLFELYALERAGNQVSGQFLIKQLFNLKLRGRYRSLGMMLENMDELSFNVTVSNLSMQVIAGSRPELDIDLDMFLYVRMEQEISD